MRERMAELGGDDSRRYSARIVADPAELDELAGRATILESYFLRNPEFLESLAEDVLPQMAAGKSHVAIWSAGCGRGEEAHSLAATCLRVLPPDSFTVLGTDVSSAAISQARSGTYSNSSVRTSPEGLPGLVREVKPGVWEVTEEIRRLVSFRRHNLVHDKPPGTFDLIVCQNVMIYMDRHVAADLVDRLVHALTPDGLVIVTPAEALVPPPESLSVTSIGSCVGYARRAPGAAKLTRKPIAARSRPRPPSAAAPRRRRAARVPAGEAPLANAPRRTRARPAGQPDGERGDVGSNGVDDQLRRSFEAADRGNYDDAEALVARVLEGYPLRADAHMLSGLLHLRRGRADEAREALRRALFFDPDLSVAHFHLATALEQLGEPTAALSSYRLALREVKLHEDDTHLAEEYDIAEIAAACERRIAALADQGR